MKSLIYSWSSLTYNPWTQITPGLKPPALQLHSIFSDRFMGRDKLIGWVSEANSNIILEAELGKLIGYSFINILRTSSFYSRVWPSVGFVVVYIYLFVKIYFRCLTKTVAIRITIVPTFRKEQLSCRHGGKWLLWGVYHDTEKFDK